MAFQSGRTETTDKAPASLDARRRRLEGLIALGLYLILALVCFWRVFAVGFGNSLPPHSVDAYQEVWFLSWLPHSLGAVTSPFFSSDIFAPHGVNLLANASIPGLGLVLSPVTALFGPVASFDTLCIAAPTLTAFTAFLAARRFVARSSLGFVAGFCFGFGPFLRTDLQYGHLHITFLALLPLILLVLTDLLRSNSGSQIRRGLALAGLLIAQFFISTELFVVTLVVATIGLVVLGLSAPSRAVALMRRLWPCTAVAAVVTAACIGYPAWYALAGPRHVVGPVWPHMGRLSADLTAAVLPHAERPGVGFISGGNGDYLGLGLVVVIVVGTVCLFRNRTVLFFALMTAASELLSLGYWLHVGQASTGVPLPGWLFSKLPVLQSVVMSRFGAPLDLFAGILLALVLEGFIEPLRGAALNRSEGRGHVSSVVVGGLAALAVVPLAFEPVAWSFQESGVPRVPAAFAHLKGAKGHRPVVLVYPETALSAARQMLWQAREGFSFRDASGYAIIPGPGRRPTESLPVDAESLVFAAGFLHRLVLPLSSSAKEALSSELRGDHLAEVLVDLRAPGGRQVGEALTEALGGHSRAGRYLFWRFGP